MRWCRASLIVVCRTVPTSSAFSKPWDFKNGPSAATTYSVLFAQTADGVSDTSTLQFLNAFGHIPLFWRIGVGGGYAWYGRKTTYPGFFEAQKTQSEWRAYLSVKL